MSKFYYSSQNGNTLLYKHRGRLKGVSGGKLLCLADLITYLLYRTTNSKNTKRVTLSAIAQRLLPVYEKKLLDETLSYAARRGILKSNEDFTVLLFPKDQWFK